MSRRTVLRVCDVRVRLERQWSTPRADRFPQGQRPDTHFTGVRVNLGAGLDGYKSLPLQVLEPQTPIHK